jgi:hypothetical protein
LTALAGQLAEFGAVQFGLGVAHRFAEVGELLEFVRTVPGEQVHTPRRGRGLPQRLHPSGELLVCGVLDLTQLRVSGGGELGWR